MKPKKNINLCVNSKEIKHDLDIEEGDLQTRPEMMAQAVVTEDDIKEKNQRWLDDPPDNDFKNILKAEVVEDEEETDDDDEFD